MTAVPCQAGAYGSVPAFPASHQSRMGGSDLVPCWKRAAGPRPIPSSIKKPSPRLAVALRTPCSGMLRAGQASGTLAWDSLSHHHPYCPSAVPSRIFFFTFFPFFFFFVPMGFGANPKRDVMPSPIPTCSSSVRHLAMSLIFGVLIKARLFRTTCRHHTQDTAQPAKMSHHSRDSAGTTPVLPILGFVRLW